MLKLPLDLAPIKARREWHFIRMMRDRVATNFAVLDLPETSLVHCEALNRILKLDITALVEHITAQEADVDALIGEIERLQSVRDAAYKHIDELNKTKTDTGEQD